MASFFARTFAASLVACCIGGPSLQTVRAAPQAGEISVEGAISALQIEARSITIQAERFVLPGGKSGAIAPAKAKSIEIGAATRLVGPAGISMQSLLIGSKVRVTGRDAGSGNALPAREIEFLSGSLRESVTSQPVSAPPVEAAPPKNALEGDLKLQVLESGFAVPPAVYKDNYSWWATTPAFYARVQLQEGDQTKKGFQLRVLSPGGVPQENCIGLKDYVFSQTVDPSWPFVWVEAFGRDAEADEKMLDPTGEQANGIFKEIWEVPMPQLKPQEAVHLNQSVKTRWGATVEIGEIKLEPRGESGTLHFDLKWAPPPDVPFSVGETAIWTEDGTRLSWGGGSSTSIGKGTFRVDVPKLAVGRSKLRISLNHHILSRASAAGRYRVRVQVPLSAQTPLLLDANERAARKKPNQRPLTEASFTRHQGIEVRLEEDDYWATGWWRARLFVRDTNGMPGRVWKVAKATMVEPGAEKRVSVSGNFERISWRSDGSASPPEEWTQPLNMIEFNENERAQSRLCVDLEAHQLVKQNFRVTVPLPKEGETVVLNEEVQSDNDQPITVSDVTFYVGSEPLPHLPHLPRRGIAIAFEIHPLVLQAATQLSIRSARDDADRPLMSSPHASVYRGHIFDRERPYTHTLFLPSPHPDAKHIHIEGISTEQGPVTEKTTISIPLPSVVIPPTP